MALNIVLFRPLIPQNTGNIGRLCVGINAKLHLIKPLGFDLSEKSLRRAGLDYWPYLDTYVHENFEEFQDTLNPNAKIWLISKFGESSIYQKTFSENDYFIFGQETKGLPSFVMNSVGSDQVISIPMFSQNIRCLNLANSVAITAYEAIRQIHSL